MPQRIAKQIYNELKKADSIMIVPHQNPDGDAMGAATAMAQILDRMNIKHVIFCATESPSTLSFLEHANELKTSPSIWKKEKFSHILTVDCSSLDYAGIEEFINKLDYQPTLINIDHHSSNELYGNINLVIPDSSSTTEILYNFFKVNDIDIDEEIATSLMTGLLYDTSNFSNSGTSKKALSIASELSRQHANTGIIRKCMIQNKSVAALKTTGIVLSRLVIDPTTNIAYTILKQEDFGKNQVKEEELEGIANMLNHLKEGVASMVFKENQDKTVKISMRTTKNDVDVSKIAKMFGGGGHKKASGFSINKPLDQAVKYFFETLEKNKITFVKQ